MNMRICFVVNDIGTERAEFTTTRLAVTALAMGHESWYVDVGDFAYDPDATIAVRARSAPRQKYSSRENFLQALQGDKAVKERLHLNDVDVLLLRNDPAEDALERPWAAQSGVVFGRRASRQGVIVLNNPQGLSRAMNKMYFQDFPEEVRPRTLITRDRDDIKEFAREQGGTIVLKPLQGSGGQNVFLVRPDDGSNLNQMIEAISRDGYVVAQEYLSEAVDGDSRVFMMNGLPLMTKGKYAGVRRIRSEGDMRSNVHAGGSIAPLKMDDRIMRIAEIIRPKLVMDGMFLVGLDIVGDKLMEVNVFSPGGLGSAQEFEKVDFTRTVIEALERKVSYAAQYRRSTDMAVIAML
ncbi:MAG TPA: glutathione synthetase [Gemmatimonadales bacterium]|nr:glutathione synthetase [Gemmatimonadales bacterium]